MNVAEIVIGTKALGPGLRSAVWFQGCPFRCEGCYSPAWIPDVPNRSIPADQLAYALLEDPRIQGVTISGGDPFFQPEALFDLLVSLRKMQPDISILVFTGYLLAQLENRKEWRGLSAYMPLIDVLIDGLYIEALNDDVGLRGSSNQGFHYFSNRHINDNLETLPRLNEITVTNESIQLVGIPTLVLSGMVLNDSLRKDQESHVRS